MARPAAKTKTRLPEWDLGDLYPGSDSKAFKTDLAAAREKADAFAARYQGKVASLAPAEFAAAIRDYEALQDLTGRIASYAQLLHEGDLADPEIGRVYQNTQEAMNAVGTTLLFFVLEINRIEDKALEAKLADKAAAKYRPWLRDIR
ncbi:MAG: oligoendopeptidase F, partial [Alphaproteobacteria bacterium]|nr:oligoendopeptidase F [Alphaproteobacteria bacterium]